MESIALFFLDPLAWPAAFYIVAYVFVWAIALAVGQSLRRRISIERAVAFAWGIALFIHIMGGAIFIISLWDRAHNRFGDGLTLILYLLFYVVLMIVDGCLLVLILSQNRKKRDTNPPPAKPARKSRNPKKQ